MNVALPATSVDIISLCTGGYPRDVDGRGSPRDQARARQKMYGDLAKEWQGSTPGIEGECAISADFEAGDRRSFYVPCPHCAVFQALGFDQLRGPDGERPAHMRCLSCDGVILDGHKHEMLARGAWIARRVREDEPSVPERMTAAELDRWRARRTAIRAAARGGDRRAGHADILRPQPEGGACLPAVGAGDGAGGRRRD